MFALTQQEKQVILFLVALGLAGTGIQYLAKKFSPVRAIACVHEKLGKVNINTADKDILKTIPGVGEKLAQRIIEYRKANGGFAQPEELKNIKGFYQSRYEKAKTVIFAE